MTFGLLVAERLAAGGRTSVKAVAAATSYPLPTTCPIPTGYCLIEGPFCDGGTCDSGYAGILVY